ncbi:retromer complex subunit Vps29 [Schizosaccharomyces octosporus yFS286]|uniref:Vacuolar protein sorting-associated protein 29 n=1 Tax=Schizosaccharomyces octosporus (strain yFS286) TaxID=483514 RepID=S9Q2J5_SCHOY|nr:retromer complex subunit Vps29 [Schizosaccharomyces octosporus yFS286]EPX73928.1 retromer complex subunit Vps29 [Schizosaccharomyces octosporus yFS286]
MLVLVIGDFHIPNRSPKLSEKFRQLLIPGKINQIICLGNLTSPSIYDYLKHVCADLKLVRGAYDIDSKSPIAGKLTLGSFKVAYTSGHLLVPQDSPEALSILARDMDADIVLYGNTHKFSAFELDNCFFVNPGSATGAPTVSTANDDTKITPSFVLMDVQGAVLILYVYRIFDGEVRVEKMQYRKPE